MGRSCHRHLQLKRFLFPFLKERKWLLFNVYLFVCACMSSRRREKRKNIEAKHSVFIHCIDLTRRRNCPTFFLRGKKRRKEIPGNFTSIAKRCLQEWLLRAGRRSSWRRGTNQIRVWNIWRRKQIEMKYKWVSVVQSFIFLPSSFLN